MVEELTYRGALLPLKYLVVNATSTAEYCPLSMTKWPEASLPAPVIRGWALASHGGGKRMRRHTTREHSPIAFPLREAPPTKPTFENAVLAKVKVNLELVL